MHIWKIAVPLKRLIFHIWKIAVLLCRPVFLQVPLRSFCAAGGAGAGGGAGAAAISPTVQ